MLVVGEVGRMDKRYQVFVSSTYADLKEERRAVIQTIIEMDCIPAGMELFPAADEEQLKFIKRVIDDCDYYLLIIGGRYGSVGADGVSYTEQEYEYAVSRGLKVIAVIHENPDEIPFGKSEKDIELRKRLDAFRNKVTTGRLVKFWNKASDLPGIVALSLSRTMHEYPSVGWVRGNKVASEELLAEINDLRKRNSEMQGTVTKLKIAIAELKPAPATEFLAGLDEKIKVFGDYFDSYHQGKRSWNAEVTWRKIFAHICPYMAQFPNDRAVKSILANALFKDYNNRAGNNVGMDDQTFRTIALQLQALGLVTQTYSEAVGGNMALFWSLPGAGERLMMEVRTVPTAATQKDATA